ncbi:MAG: hypothetical protein KDN19_24030, partial [Verrucomicrobiae bacterium]|nr:hypothetical protein [Verrucomicrobiae bacterium]
GWLGHRSLTSSGISDTSLTVRGSSLDTTTGVSGSDLTQVLTRVDTILRTNLDYGDVTLIDMGSGGIWVDQEIRATTSNSLNLLSYTDIYVGDDLINPGDGDINLVAGWDPSVNDLADLSPNPEVAPYRGYVVKGVDFDSSIFDNAGSFGAGGGSVFVGLDADMSGTGAGVMVGSRFGDTRVAGYDVNVWAAALATNTPYSHAQIGYNRQDTGEGTVP